MNFEIDDIYGDKAKWSFVIATVKVHEPSALAEFGSEIRFMVANLAYIDAEDQRTKVTPRFGPKGAQASRKALQLFMRKHKTRIPRIVVGDIGYWSGNFADMASEAFDCHVCWAACGPTKTDMADTSGIWLVGPHGFVFDHDHMDDRGQKLPLVRITKADTLLNGSNC
jgi:hypothetical protein